MAAKDPKGFAIFTTFADGWQALIDDLTYKCTGRSNTSLTPTSTIRNLVYTYAPPTDRNPSEAYLAGLLGHMRAAGFQTFNESTPIAHLVIT